MTDNENPLAFYKEATKKYVDEELSDTKDPDTNKHTPTPLPKETISNEDLDNQIGDVSDVEVDAVRPTFSNNHFISNTDGISYDENNSDTKPMDSIFKTVVEALQNPELSDLEAGLFTDIAKSITQAGYVNINENDENIETPTYYRKFKGDVTPMIKYPQQTDNIPNASKVIPQQKGNIPVNPTEIRLQNYSKVIPQKTGNIPVNPTKLSDPNPSLRTEEEAKAEWLKSVEKRGGSPASKSGAFTPEELWNQRKIWLESQGKENLFSKTIES